MENIERELKIVELYKQGISQKQICKECKCSTNTISDVIDKYNIPRRAKRKKNKDLSKFKESLEVINGNNIIIMKVNNYGIDSLKQIIDNLINEYDNLFILLANINNNNINFIAKSKNTSINCGDIIKNISLSCHGNGGGNPSFGQGGGSDATNIEEYLEDLKKSLK